MTSEEKANLMKQMFRTRRLRTQQLQETALLRKRCLMQRSRTKPRSLQVPHILDH